jgi:integrase
MAINKIKLKSGQISWEVNWREPSRNGTPGRRRKKRFSLKRDAQAFMGSIDKAKFENRYGDVFNEKRERNMTFGEFAAKYQTTFQHQKSFKGMKKYILRTLKARFGERLLSDITYLDLELFRNDRISTTTVRKNAEGKYKLRSRAAVNRELAVLRHMFNKAVQWEYLSVSPFSLGMGLFFKEDNMRVRYLSTQERERLLASCSEDLHPIVVFALHTGMRKGEILSLTWSKINEGFIHVEETKSDTSRQVPINKNVQEVLDNQQKKNPDNSPFVFCKSDGSMLKEIKTSFRTALQKAKITNFCFHSLRHTFASYLAMRGVSMKVIQEILGHQDIRTTMRYAHLSPEQHQNAVKILEDL